MIPRAMLVASALHGNALAAKSRCPSQLEKRYVRSESVLLHEREVSITL
jgi:hypothetical protein